MSSLELHVVPVDPNDPLFGLGDHLLRLEEEIRGRDLKSLDARWRSGNTINRLKVETRSRVNVDGTRRMLPQKTKKLVEELLQCSKSEVKNRMRLAEKYQVTDLGNLLLRFPTWHDICRDALYEKRPTPDNVTPVKRSISPVARSARDFTRELRTTPTLTVADCRALRALLDAITTLLAGSTS